MIIPTNKVIVILYLVVFALIIPAQAADLSQFETTCLDIGFKKKTEALSDCILELMLRAKRTNSELQAAQQKAYEQEQQYKREAEARAIERNNQELGRQQIQALRQQQQYQQQQEHRQSIQEIVNILNPPRITCRGLVMGDLINTECQ